MTSGISTELFTIANPKENLEEIVVEVQYKWMYDPGMWTMPNGDPGYPPSSDIEIVFIKSVSPLPEWFHEDLVYEAINNKDSNSF